MEMLGDVGGFIEAVMLAPVFFMGFYASRMYATALYKELP